MAMLTVWTFGTAEGAEESTKLLHDLAEQDRTAVRDAATVSWAAGTGKPRTRHIDDLADAEALGPAFWGLLFGMLFYVPLLGAALGAATGALSGSLADVGIDDGFINRVRDEVTPGTSALFVLTSDGVVDRVREAFTGADAPRLLSTGLSAEQEAALREVFSD